MSDNAKPLTTAEVESWQVALGRRWGARIGPRGHEVVIEGDRILATTRALEKLEEGLRLWHGTPPDERARLAIDKAGELWRSAVERAEKAEAERDEARAMVAELVTALERIVTGYEGEDEDFGASVYEIALAALAKAKGATNG